MCPPFLLKLHKIVLISGWQTIKSITKNIRNSKHLKLFVGVDYKIDHNIMDYVCYIRYFTVQDKQNS